MLCIQVTPWAGHGAQVGISTDWDVVLGSLVFLAQPGACVETGISREQGAFLLGPLASVKGLGLLL